MSYTNEDARFDYEAMHGEACTRHGRAHCLKCCIECGRKRPCEQHDTLITAHSDGTDWWAESYSGGVWWPDAAAMKEIREAEEPADAVITMSTEQPARGDWRV